MNSELSRIWTCNSCIWTRNLQLVTRVLLFHFTPIFSAWTKMLWNYIKKLSKHNNNYDQFEVERVKKKNNSDWSKFSCCRNILKNYQNIRTIYDQFEAERVKKKDISDWSKFSWLLYKKVSKRRIPVTSVYKSEPLCSTRIQPQVKKQPKRKI